MRSENSYVSVFNKFLSGDYELFPTIEDSILAWKIIEKFERAKSGDLVIYEKGLGDFENIK
jgi:hypothetical protein